MELVPTKSIEITAPTKTVDRRLHLNLLETWYRNIPRMNSAGGSRKKLSRTPPSNYYCCMHLKKIKDLMIPSAYIPEVLLTGPSF